MFAGGQAPFPAPWLGRKVLWIAAPAYTGPVLVITAGYPMLRKLVRLAKQHNVTSIADFLASRYGKSRVVGVAATLFATVGVLPYIALQLQAVSSTFPRSPSRPAGSTAAAA